MPSRLSLLSITTVLSLPALAQVAVEPENGYAMGQKVPLPEPYLTKSADRRTQIIGWQDASGSGWLYR